ncbi:MAG: amidohydrolase family protein [Acidobacteria bacterium]|nr:amidohydrolase family protein [Acidobacteriota bacterium]
MNTLFVHSARQLLTLRGAAGPRRGLALAQLQIIDDGAILIEDGVILEVGPTRRLENLGAARRAQEVCATGRVVMPGFVDSHTHLISGPPKLSGGAGDGATHPVRPTDAAYIRDVSSRRLATEACQAVEQCLRHGTTAIEAKSGYGLDATGELKILRALTTVGDGPVTVAPTFSAGSTPPPEFEGRRGEYMTWLANDLLPRIHKRGLARFVTAACDSESFTADEIRPYLVAGRELGMPLKLDLAHEGSAEASDLLAELAFTSVDHVEHLEQNAGPVLAGSGAVAVLTPTWSFFNGRRYAPARMLIELGVPVALASNFSRASNPSSNMQTVIFLACKQMGLTVAEAVSAATINSAHALRLGHRLGSIEPGKQADILVLNVGDYRELGFDFGINLVDMTIRGGVAMTGQTGAQWPRAS